MSAVKEYYLPTVDKYADKECDKTDDLYEQWSAEYLESKRED